MFLSNCFLRITFLFFFFLIASLPIFSQNHSDKSIQSIYDKIDVFIENETLDSALFYYHRLLPDVKEASDSNYIFSELGYVYAVLENYEESVAYFKKALQNALSRTPSDSFFIEDQYYYVAYSYLELEDYDLALKYNNESLKLTSEESYPIDYGKILSNIATIYFQKSDYDNAISYEQKALSLFEKSNDLQLIAESENGLALYHYYKQNYTHAIKYSLAAVDIFEKILADSVAENCISAYNNYVLNLIQLEDFENAKKYLEKAFAIHQTWDIDQQFEITQFNQAFLYFKTKQWGMAFSEFKKSIDTYSKKNPKGHTNIGKAYYYIGKINEEQEKQKEALQAYQTSLQILVPDFKSEDVLQNPNLENYCRSHRNLLRALVAKAGVLSSQYLEADKNVNLESAIFQTYDLAIQIADELRQSYRAEGSRYFLAEETKELFEDAIGFSYQLYHQTKNQKYLEKAFFYVEKNQAPILFQNQLASEEQAIGGVPIDILKKEKQLKNDFYFYKNQFAKNRNDKKKSQRYSDYMFDSKQQLDSLQELLEKNYPQYFAYQYGQQRLTITDLQKELSDDQLFIQYYQVSKQIFVFAISKTTSDLFLVEDVSLIKDKVVKLLACLQNPLTQSFPEQEGFEKMTTSAHQLYAQLVAPTFSKLDKKPTRLAIGTNGFLTGIPFEILLSESVSSEKIDYLSLPYMVKEFAISYQPSASLMIRLKNKKRGLAKKDLLAVAPFSNNEKELTEAMTRSSLGNLPFTKNEIENLETLFSAKTLHQSQALKSTFLKQASAYQILHLATHGIADFRQGDNARLFFYPDKRGDSLEHILHSYEVQNLQLNADLTVLSACETGAGKLDVGEGVLSLARSFFYTGVPSVIMSKWQINDQSSSLIINGLYRGLKKKITKDIALQNAKIKFLQSDADMVTAHPFYWAGLVQLGSATALEFEKNNWWIWGGIAFLLSGLGFYFFWKKR